MYGDAIYGWARRLAPDGSRLLDDEVKIADMFDEVVNGDMKKPKQPRAPNFVREVPYAMASWAVHSLEPSVSHISSARASNPFFELSVQYDGDSFLTPVLDGANIHGLVAMSVFDQYAGLGLDADVEKIRADMVEQLSGRT